MEFNESQKNKNEVIAEARNGGRKVHLASLVDLCHLKNSKLEPQYQKYKGRVVLRADIVKDDSGSYAVFAEQGSSASQMTAARVMDITSRLPGCAGQAADAVSAYSQIKMEDAPSLFKNSKVRMSRYLDTSTEAQMAKIIVQYGRPSRSFQSGICTVIVWQDFHGKGNLRKFYWNTIGKKFQIGSACSLTKKKDYSYLCMWTTYFIGWKETKYQPNVENTHERP